MKLPIRIAIIETGLEPGKWGNEYGGVGKVSAQHLMNATEGAGIEKRHLDISNHYIEEFAEAYPDLDEVDAIYVTGSPHDAFDDRPWIVALVKFVKQALSHPRVLVIAVCFGHQIVGRALGLEVKRGSGWELSIVPLKLTDSGKRIFGREEISMQQSHKDIVCPAEKDVDFEVLASTEICPNHGMYREGKFFTVQGHPEVGWDVMEDLILLRQDLFSPEVFKDALSRARNEANGPEVGVKFLQFLLQDGRMGRSDVANIQLDITNNKSLSAKAE